MEPQCLGKPSDPGRSGTDNRRFVEAVLWIARTGSPWRDLPPEFGKWNTVFKRFRDWVKADVFQRLFDAVPIALHARDRRGSLSGSDVVDVEASGQLQAHGQIAPRGDVQKGRHEYRSPRTSKGSGQHRSRGGGRKQGRHVISSVKQT